MNVLDSLPDRVDDEGGRATHFVGGLVKILIGVSPLGDAEHVLKVPVLQVTSGDGEPLVTDPALVEVEDLGEVVDVENQTLAEVLAENNRIDDDPIVSVGILLDVLGIGEEFFKRWRSGQEGVDFDEYNQVADLQTAWVRPENEQQNKRATRGMKLEPGRIGIEAVWRRRLARPPLSSRRPHRCEKGQSVFKSGMSLTWCLLASVDDFKTIQPST